MSKKHYNNTLQRARIIKDLAARHYERGNYARSYYQVWRNYVNKSYPMCYRTFLKYINMDTSQLDGRGTAADHVQLALSEQ